MAKTEIEYYEHGIIYYGKIEEVMKIRRRNWQYLINKGIHRQTIYRMKRCEPVSTATICKICDLLNCQPGHFMLWIPPEMMDDFVQNTPRYQKWLHNKERHRALQGYPYSGKRSLRGRYKTSKLFGESISETQNKENEEKKDTE